MTPGFRCKVESHSGTCFDHCPMPFPLEDGYNFTETHNVDKPSETRKSSPLSCPRPGREPKCPGVLNSPTSRAHTPQWKHAVHTFREHSAPPSSCRLHHHGKSLAFIHDNLNALLKVFWSIETSRLLSGTSKSNPMVQWP